MKSRNFLHTRSIEADDSAAKGLLLSRSLGVRASGVATPGASGDVATVTAVRHFELQHNQSPRYARRRQERRKGQALLLAVLIMLLAALLSAGVLAVVSGNLNQSARVADKTRAIEASRAGIAYANAQLSGSSQGDLWRPIDVSPAPAPGDTGYNFYYSQLDKVKGWANRLTPPTDTTLPNYERDKFIFRNVTYGKFPDPNQVASDAPKFLVKVEELPIDPTNAYYNPAINPGHTYDAEHAGQLKITSIGLSEDDPNVYHEAVAYKVGRAKSPWASALRSVSNWKFGTNDDNTGVPYGPALPLPGLTVAANANPSANVDVSINNVDKPQFLGENVPFNVVIVKKDATSTVRGAVVTKVVTTGTTTTLTLAKLDNDILAGEVIQKAAAIGTGSTIDLLNTGQLPATLPAGYLNIPTQPQPNGILANGSVWLQNQIQLSNLSKNGTKLFASGSLAIDDNLPTDTKYAAPGGDIDTTNTMDPDSNRIVDSAKSNFPGNIELTSAATSNGVVPLDLIRDGWNKIGTTKTLGLEYIPDQTRTVKPFTPARIDSSTNVARYRALTRNSADGVYIDNRGDVEKVGTNNMTQAELLKMLNSDAATATDFYLRNAVAGGTSLEEKHLRGWISPDEFMARGALVELFPSTLNDPGPNAPNPFLRVTYDARSDTNFNGPDLNKAARGADGQLTAGIYTQTLKWPSNGTLFAEGNVRIRGKVTLPAIPTDGSPDLFPSLTVVSMNNVYIEGSVSVDSALIGGNPSPSRKKLMLLAKKNVIANPTRLVLGHVDEQTLSTNTVDVVATGTAPNQSIVIPVKDAFAFRVGDVVETYDTAGALGIRGIITTRDLTAGANTLTASILSGTTVVAFSPVKTLLTDKIGAQTANGGTTPTKYFSVTSEEAVERRVLLQDASARYPLLRLTLDHLAERKSAFKIETEAFGVDAMTNVPYTKTAGLSVKLTNKRVAAGGTFDTKTPIVKSDDKRIFSVYNLPAAGTDTFPDPTANPFTDATIDTATNLPNAENSARGFSLAALKAEIEAVPGRKDDMAKQGWKYKADTTTTPTDIPFFYLAAIGLRPDVSGSTPPVTTTDGVDVGPTAFDIPLAASIRVQRNQLDQTLTTLYNSQTTVNPIAESFSVPYIGFNPLYGVVGAVPNDANAYEDVLSVDQSFYQTNPNILKSIIDSRRTATNFTTNDALVLRQNNDLLTGTAPITLPEYRVRALKLENTDLGTPQNPAVAPTAPIIRPIDLEVDAYVYAQEGSWLVIPGDYFRTDPQVRTEVDSTGNVVGTYIDDVTKNSSPDAGEFILDADGTTKVADLNRNGIVDPGEAEAALRFVRYNYKINFYGAIVENQTAVVADVKNPTAPPNAPPLVQGAVQNWMDKWAAYDSTATGANVKDKFRFITYAYDPSLALGTPNANQLRVPVTDDLLYQQ